MSLWNELDRALVLASQSPRRRDILNAMGLRFAVVAPDVGDESHFFCGGDHESEIRLLARTKGRCVSAIHPDKLVLAADTVVIKGTSIMGKPRDRDEAAQMLETLSGKEHTVVTAVALVCTSAGFSTERICRTCVRFRTLAPGEIEQYLLKGDYGDKAGAYGIQGSALVFVESIRGCYYNVVGLPVATTINLLNDYHTCQGAAP